MLASGKKRFGGRSPLEYKQDTRIYGRYISAGRNVQPGLTKLLQAI